MPKTTLSNARELYQHYLKHGDFTVLDSENFQARVTTNTGDFGDQAYEHVALDYLPIVDEVFRIDYDAEWESLFESEADHFGPFVVVERD